MIALILQDRCRKELALALASRPNARRVWVAAEFAGQRLEYTWFRPS